MIAGHRPFLLCAMMQRFRAACVEHGKGTRMNTPVNSLSAACLAFLLLALLTVGTNAAAGNVFDGFTKAPTFTPPVGCTPKEQTYGVLSRCEKTIEPGRTFVALIDTAVGFFKTDKAQNTQIFVDDHVAEIRRSEERRVGKECR